MAKAIVCGPSVLFTAVQASRKDTNPSGPGRFPICWSPPKSTTSSVVVTVTS